MLAARGFRVVRFDNRDVGRSTKSRAGPRADVMAAAAGDPSSASYTLDDMADDCAGLLDHLGVDAAHLVGASQGGMIAQTLAIRHPERALSLASIMSTTGDRSVGQPHPEAIPALMTSAAGGSRGVRGVRGVDVEGDRVAGVRRRRGRRFAPGRARATTGASTRRGRRGSWWRSWPRAIAPRRCATLDLPTLVIHGTDDALIDVSGGKATAAAIPGAELVLIEGMGHDLPRPLWPRFVDLIVANAERARTLDSAR